MTYIFILDLAYTIPAIVKYTKFINVLKMKKKKKLSGFNKMIIKF